MKITSLLLMLTLCLCSFNAFTQDAKAKAATKLAFAKEIAANPQIIAAVKAFNAAKPAALSDMNQDKWKALTRLDPIVRDLSKNEAGVALKSKQSDFVSEMFLNGKDGCKVALLAKTSSWCHSGKDKHELPMKNKEWIGDVEVDESTGIQSIQIAVPVLDGTTPIGSLIIGLNVSKI